MPLQILPSNNEHPARQYWPLKAEPVTLPPARDTRYRGQLSSSQLQSDFFFWLLQVDGKWASKEEGCVCVCVSTCLALKKKGKLQFNLLRGYKTIKFFSFILIKCWSLVVLEELVRCFWIVKFMSTHLFTILVTLQMAAKPSFFILNMVWIFCVIYFCYKIVNFMTFS